MRDRQTDTQMAVTNIHFASATPHAKCDKTHSNYLLHSYSIKHGADYKLSLSVSQRVCLYVGTVMVTFLDRFSPKVAQK